MSPQAVALNARADKRMETMRPLNLDDLPVIRNCRVQDFKKLNERARVKVEARPPLDLAK